MNTIARRTLAIGASSAALLGLGAGVSAADTGPMVNNCEGPKVQLACAPGLLAGGVLPNGAVNGDVLPNGVVNGPVLPNGVASIPVSVPFEPGSIDVGGIHFGA